MITTSNVLSNKSSGAISPMQVEMQNERAKQEKETSQIVDLGRIFEMAIDSFIKERGDIGAKVVLGSCDYIIKTYKERMSAIAENYGTLKRIVDTEGIKIREPYTNDGVASRAAGFNAGDILMPKA